jgi:predicted CXXCH cytochrome family protein
MRKRILRLPCLILIASASGALAGCDDIVYRDRPFFTAPIESALSFLGYSDEAEKITVCGQCHVSFQRKWEGTQHSQAWATLQANAAAGPQCDACHTTNSRGNVVEGTVGGYVAHADARYEDVQCESCHGPGLEHVRSPSRDTWPLASIAAGPDLGNGCGECHTGAHQPFVEQWASSGHAVVQASRSSNPACSGCHRGQDVLRAWGVTTEYLERTAAEHLPITCGVCHSPHDATNPKQLRARIDVPSEEENLCMKCHHKRGTPDPTTFRGPHSPQGPLLLGVAGWWPPNLELQPGELVPTHGSEANPQLCAGCHVNRYEVRDALTGQFMFRATGHTFEAIPCVDQDGIPTGSRECELPDRTFQTCAKSGCHGTESIARNLLILARGDIDDLVAIMLAMEAQIPASEFDHQDSRYTTAEGARFNRELAQQPGSAIHNPFLVKALLNASIRQVRDDYGIPIPPGASLQEEFGSS